MITRPKRPNPFLGFKASKALDARGRIHGLVTWSGKTVTVCHYPTCLWETWQSAYPNADEFRKRVVQIRRNQYHMAVGYGDP